jgi:hypothetical protein
VLISRRAIRGYRDPASRNLPIWKLEAALKCRSCKKGRHAARARDQLTMEREIAAYVWVHPDEER